MMRSVTKAMPVQFINSKCHIQKRRGHKTALSGYYACFSCDLLVIPSGVDTHTNVRGLYCDSLLNPQSNLLY